MEKSKTWIPTVKQSSMFCRICVSLNDVEYHILPINEGGEGNSLYMMLRKLFPNVFNDEQTRNDQFINWPKRICQDCRRKVMEAFNLYEICVASTVRLRKMMKEESSCLGIESDSDFPSDTIALGEMKRDKISEEQKKHDERTTINAAMVPIKTEDVPYITQEDQARPRRTTRNRGSLLDGCSLSNSKGVKTEEEGKLCRSSLKTSSKILKKRRSTSRKKKSKLKTTNETSDSEDMLELDESKTKMDFHRCQLCDSPDYNCQTELNNHLKAEHPEQIRSCEQCPKVFMNEQTFQHHQYCHATGRSHFCMFCDKGFQKQNLLESHIRTHTKRGDFLCSLCGKEFTNYTNLRQHTKIKHSGEKPWACTLCPSRFTTKGSLKMHQFTHTKVKKFSCETCGTQFTKHSSLVKHRLIHTGERPFVCEVCKMRFVSNYMLKRHMLTHTGEKPFKCTYCERSFAQSNDMVKHIRTHVGDNLYKCDRCDSSYRLLSELRNHYTAHYQSGEGTSLGCTTADVGKNIRFTTTYIMKLRMEQEKSARNGSGQFSSTV